jgi:hypothetical protein
VFTGSTIEDEDSGRDASFDSRVDPMIFLDQARPMPDLAYLEAVSFGSQGEESRPQRLLVGLVALDMYLNILNTPIFKYLLFKFI